MIKRLLVISFIIILSNQFVRGQDFEFQWQVEPSFWNNYTVRINKSGAKRRIVIKLTNSSDSIVKRINKVDVYTLVEFLNRYDFPIYPSSIVDTKREYYETTILADTTWVLFRGDSIRKKSLWYSLYYYDTDSSKYFSEIKHYVNSLDGTLYKGYYITEVVQKIFEIKGPTRTSLKDRLLNKMMYDFLIKYDKKTNYSHLLNQLDI